MYPSHIIISWYWNKQAYLNLNNIHIDAAANAIKYHKHVRIYPRMLKYKSIL